MQYSNINQEYIWVLKNLRHRYFNIVNFKNDFYFCTVIQVFLFVEPPTLLYKINWAINCNAYLVSLGKGHERAQLGLGEDALKSCSCFSYYGYISGGT